MSDVAEIETVVGGLRIKGTNASETLLGGNGNDELEGKKGDDVLSGGAGDDDLDGDKGDDTLYGGAGNDTLDGEMGNDLLFGGDGSDLFVLRSNRGDDVIEDFTVGQDILRIRFSSGIRSFSALTSRMTDDADGNAVIDLDRGSVTIRGISSSELSAGDFQFGGSRIQGGAGNDAVSGAEDDDEIDGAGGDDTISGADGDDTISGGDGLDVIYGNKDSDTILGDGGDDSLFGGQSEDDITGGDGNDVLYGNLENDSLTGSDGADTLFGGQGDDIMLGDAGNDVLFGNLGNDTISGGAGDDVLAGGSGNDQFVFADASGSDTIADFTTAGAGDTIFLASNINGTGITGFADLAGRLSDDVSGNAVIDLGGGNSVTLVGVQSSNLAADDFIFG